MVGLVTYTQYRKGTARKKKYFGKRDSKKQKLTTSADASATATISLGSELVLIVRQTIFRRKGRVAAQETGEQKKTFRTALYCSTRLFVQSRVSVRGITDPGTTERSTVLH